MSEQTHDTSELRAASSSIARVATTTVADIAAVADGVSGHASVWGTDAVGRAFAGIYLEPAEQAMTAVVQSAYQIGRVAELLGGNAQGYEATESENSTAGQGLQVDVEGSAPGTGMSA